MRAWIGPVAAVAIVVSGCGHGSANVAPAPSGTPPARGGLLPADRLTVWKPGIPGGVPVRTVVCATVEAASYGNGTQEASAGIQAALDGCPAGQVVKLSAGTFTVNNYVILRKGVTLRGAGAGQTTLQKTNGATPGSGTAPDAQPILIIGPSRWPNMDDSSTQNLTVDGAKGSYSVTVGNASGYAAGQFVMLDEDDYDTGFWMTLPNRNGSPTSSLIWATDRVVWQKHNPPEQYVDDPFPNALSWFMRSGRPINEIKEIASVSGNVISFSSPLHISYRASHSAQLTRWLASDAQVRNAGIEDLKVIGGSDGAIRFQGAAYSWVKNVEDTVWLGEGVAINNSFRCELRDSYIHDGAWPVPGGGGYAISLANGSSEILIENNIVLKANKVMVARASGTASVVGYNYMDDGFISYNLDWVEVGINGSHMVGSHHMLFEGNESFNYDADNTHGNAIYHTVFRNHLSGYRRDFAGMGNARAGGLMFGSWWHSFLGNVMGSQGRTSGWIYEDPGTPWQSDASIWKLGYDPGHWSQDPDPKVRSTVLREGNYDYVSNQVHWDTSPQTLPPSLYLTSKPAFFGDDPWPGVAPTGATKLYPLPAKARYDAGMSH